MIHFVTFESMSIANEQISAIYDNSKSRQRASGILCKCQRRDANDKQIERARLSDSNKFVNRREEKIYIRKNIINIDKN